MGGFDYVTRASQPVYIVRSKVDVRMDGAGVENIATAASASEAVSDSSETGSQTPGAVFC